jgi:hypothetical protein
MYQSVLHVICIIHVNITVKLLLSPFQIMTFLDMYIMSRYIAKTIYLDKPKRLII